MLAIRNFYVLHVSNFSTLVFPIHYYYYNKSSVGNNGSTNTAVSSYNSSRVLGDWLQKLPSYLGCFSQFAPNLNFVLPHSPSFLFPSSFVWFLFLFPLLLKIFRRKAMIFQLKPLSADWIALSHCIGRTLWTIDLAAFVLLWSQLVVVSVAFDWLPFEASVFLRKGSFL